MNRKTKKYQTINIHSQAEGLVQIVKLYEALGRGEKVKPLRCEYYESIGLLLKNLVEKRLSIKVTSSKLDERGRRELGQLVIKAFDAWNHTNEQRCVLLVCRSGTVLH